MAEPTIHLVRPGALPPVFRMSEYFDRNDVVCVARGRRRRVSMKSFVTHDPTNVTCKSCLAEMEEQAEYMTGA